MQNSKDSSQDFKNRHITLGTAVGFGITDIMGSGALTIVSAFLLFFFTRFTEMTTVQSASIIAIARILDAFVCLIIGSLTDNFYKTKLGQRFGRRRFFLLIGSPLMFSYILFWIAGMSYWYYLTVYLAFEIIIASVLIPWETLPSEMTDDFAQRTKLSATRMFIAGIASTIATFIPGQLLRIWGNDSPTPYLVNGILFATIFAICVFISYKTTWERPLTPEQRAELESKKRDPFLKTISNQLKAYISTLRLRAFVKHLIIYLGTFTSIDVFSTVFVYYCVYALLSTPTVAANILSLGFINMFLTPVLAVLLVKFGPRWLYSLGFFIILPALLGFYLLYVLKPDNMIFWFTIIGLVYQLGRGTTAFLPWNIFPFVADIDEIIAKKRRQGTFAAVMTFIRKSTVAISVLVVGIVLQKSGFVKGSDFQTPQVQDAIVGILVLGVGGLLLIAFLTMLTFRLNKRTHAIVLNEVDRLRAGGDKKDVDPETKKVVEDLTGVKYEKVWTDKFIDK
jgi:oligogalacturonide transporter